MDAVTVFKMSQTHQMQQGGTRLEQHPSGLEKSFISINVKLFTFILPTARKGTGKSGHCLDSVNNRHSIDTKLLTWNRHARFQLLVRIYSTVRFYFSGGFI